MNLFHLTLRYLSANSLRTLLSLLLILLSISLITALLLFEHQLTSRLSRDAQGIDLVVGAKGSPLQLILSSVYHVDVPTGNIPLSEAEKIMENKLVKQAIPLALGDNYQGYRIVGTTHAYPAHYEARLAAGRLWEKPLEVTVGAGVAQARGLTVGATFTGSHGLVAGGEVHGDAHYVVTGVLQPSGSVLDRLILTGVSSVWEVHGIHAAEHGHEGEEHGHEHEGEEHEHGHEEHGHGEAVASGGKVVGPAGAAQENKGLAEGVVSVEKGMVAEPEYTALLIQYATPAAAISLPRFVNKSSSLQAAAPAYELVRLLQLVGVGIEGLRWFGGLLVLIATLSLFVGLSQALQERRYDMAVMRLLGGSRWFLVRQLWLESLLLGLGGTLLGILLGHVFMGVLSAQFVLTEQFAVTGYVWLWEEYWLLGFGCLMGTLAVLFPAYETYHVDIAGVLAEE